MTSLSPLALQIPWRQSGKIFSTSGLVTIATARLTDPTSVASKVFAAIASNNDTVDHDVIIGITDSNNLFTALGTVTVPTNAGYVGTKPSVNLFIGIPAIPLDETGQPYVILNSTDVLQVKAVIALTGTHDIDIMCFGADF